MASRSKWLAPNAAAAYKAYVELVGRNRRILRAGDRIPLKGVDVQVVTSAGQAIPTPLTNGGAGNPTCDDFEEHPPEIDTDNEQSVGFVLRMGTFTFADLGDLSWDYERPLVCPASLIGKIDVYQVTNHGLDRSNSPQLLAAIQPTVAVINNGPRKGAPPACSRHCETPAR